MGMNCCSITIPNVAVVCGPRLYHRGKTDIVTNPVLIVEVLSDVGSAPGFCVPELSQAPRLMKLADGHRQTP